LVQEDLNMADKKYPLPEFLKNDCDDATYTKWLTRKANTHLKDVVEYFQECAK